MTQHFDTKKTSELEQLLDELDRLRSRVAEMIATEAAVNDNFVDQKTSPLGPRRHIRAIRNGELPGFAKGRRWLARAEDVRDYVRKLGERQLVARFGPMDRSGRRSEDSELNALAAELGFVVVAENDGSAKSG